MLIGKLYSALCDVRDPRHCAHLRGPPQYSPERHFLIRFLQGSPFLILILLALFGAPPSVLVSLVWSSFYPLITQYWSFIILFMALASILGYVSKRLFSSEAAFKPRLVDVEPEGRQAQREAAYKAIEQRQELERI